MSVARVPMGDGLIAVCPEFSELLSLNEQAGYVIGIKVRDSGVTTAVTDLGLEVRYSDETRIDLVGDASTAIDAIELAVNRALRSAVKGKKVLGIGELQYIDFVRGWAYGLSKLLERLKRHKVPFDASKVQINPNWEIYRRRGAIPVRNEPERLTSNWLRMLEAPDVIRYFEPTGAVNREALSRLCSASRYPAQPQSQGLFSFGTDAEINATFASVGKFAVKHEIGLLQFVAEDYPAVGLKKQETSNIAVSMFRMAWECYCRDRGLLEYKYSKSIGFHASNDTVKIGQKIPWRRQGEQRSSMLRNIAKGHVWQFGVSGLPAFWPFPHFKLKSRVLFAPVVGTEAGDPLDDPKKQHLLRRTVCKGWRNKQWHGRLLAFLEMISGEAPYISLPLGETAHIRLEPSPMLFSSPVSTFLPDQLSDEQEEEDETTLGRPEPEEEP